MEQIASYDSTNDRFSIVPGAVRAMAATGSASMEGLSQAVKSPDVSVRFAAVSVLRQMGRQTPEAISPLIVAIGDKNRWICGIAAEAVGRFGPLAAPATKPLLELLKSPDAYIRRRAIEALIFVGPDAHEAVKPLIKVQATDPDGSVRHAAFLALQQVNIAQVSKDSLAHASAEILAQVKTLQGPDEAASVEAARVLGDLGLRAKEAVPALVMTLRHKDKWRREAAAKALAKLAPFAGEFLPTLQMAAYDPEPEVRSAVAKAIEQIEGESHPP